MRCRVTFTVKLAHFVASGVLSLLSPSGDRTTCRHTSKSGIIIDVTNKGMAYTEISFRVSTNMEHV